jgi:hypothetical protein
MSIIQPLLLPVALPCGLVYIAIRIGRRLLDIIALAIVLRGTSPAERPAILREFGPWLGRNSIRKIMQQCWSRDV